METLKDPSSGTHHPSFLHLGTGVLSSFLFFFVSRSLLSFFFSRRLQQQPHPPQQQVQQSNPRHLWKVVNTANSLLHSLVTGLGAILCFYDSPAHAIDVVNTTSAVSIYLTAFSIGYFLFDVFDMSQTQLSRRSTKELLVHHAFVLLCFGTSLWSLRYLGFVMVALLIEVNSVFLHWRQLLLMLLPSSSSSSSSSSTGSSSSAATVTSGRPNLSFKSSSYYRAVSLLNLVTFVSFRIVTMGWMTRWLVLNKHQVANEHVYALGCIAMATIVGMSAVLFVRLIRADLPHFLRNEHTNHKHS